MPRETRSGRQHQLAVVAAALSVSIEHSTVILHPDEGARTCARKRVCQHLEPVP
jgi:hypothetical protein